MQKERKKSKKQQQEQAYEEEEKLKKNAQAEEEDEEDGNAPLPIQALVEKGIAEADIKKLVDGGYNTVECVMYTPLKTLITVKGLSEAKLEKIIQA